MTTVTVLGSPQEFGPVEVWPLCAEVPAVQAWGWGLDRVDFWEGLGPGLDTWLARNQRDIPVFLPMGHLVKRPTGSWMIADEVVLPPGAQVPVPMLRVGPETVPSEVQRADLATVLAANFPGRTSQPGTERQGVAGGGQAPGRGHPQRASRRPSEPGFDLVAHQYGLVACVAGEPIALEAFGSAELTQAYSGDMVRRLAVDLAGRDLIPATEDRVLEFLRHARRPQVESKLLASGAVAFRGVGGNAVIHGISVAPNEFLHLMAINGDHPVFGAGPTEAPGAGGLPGLQGGKASFPSA